MLSRIACVLVLVLAGASCSRDPEVVKRKYLLNGNRYFEKGKYKEAYIMYRNALKKDSRYSEAYYRVGITEMRLNRPLDALRDFRRAADTDPNFTNPDSRVQAGNILLIAYLMNENHPEGILNDIKDVSGKLLAHNPKSAPGLRLDGYAKLYGDKKPKEALQQFRIANQVAPDDSDAAMGLVQSLVADGQVEEAQKTGRSFLERKKDFAAMYDVLYSIAVQNRQTADAEQILKAKIRNVPRDPRNPEANLLQLALHYYRAQNRSAMESVLQQITSDRKDYPDGHRKVGNFYGLIRDYDAAIREFQEGMKEDENNRTTYQREIAQVLIAQNKKDEAARTLEKVLKEDPKDDRAQAMRASLLLETGDPKQIQDAVGGLQSAIGRDPKNPVLRFNLGRALLAKAQVDPSRGAQYLDQARLQFQEAVNLHKGYMAARLALAQIFLAKRDYAGALQQAKEILDIDPRNIQGKLVRTNALAAMNDRIQARKEIEEMLKENPALVEASVQLAILDLRESRFGDAEQIFQKLYASNPADLRSLMGLTETYAAQERWDKALAVLDAELKKSPGRVELQSALGNIAFRAKRYDLAVKAFQNLVAARPDSADAYIRLGQSYRMQGDLAAATRTFDKARQLRPNDPAPYLQLALILEKAGRSAEARPIYDQILKLQPDHAIALNNLAYIIAESGGDLDQALALAQRAKQKLPENADVADTLGWIYIKKNLSDNAVDIFRGLISRYPDRSTFHYHLGMALYQRGDKPQARKELTTALSQSPSGDEAAKIKELLAKTGS